ncbi:MAG: hypothetical protein NVV57_09040 [Demequina sp.]|nr:hypothetical protein [Demequina sp.]
MTLRTAGLIAGVLGVILLVVGVIANQVKPAAIGSPSASLDTTVLVVPPEVLAISPDAVLTVATSGAYATHTARTQDVDAWTEGRGAITLTGISDWESLTYDDAPAAVVPSVSPIPSASASASNSPSSSPSASPSASPTASVSPSASPSPSVGPTPLGSQDIWRETAQSDATYTIETAKVPAGLTLVVEALGDTKLTNASITIPRTIDDDWITQILWWGAALAILGLIALIALFIDVRPAQTKGEEWLAHRSGIGSGKEEPRPGSRRARRQAGAAIPVVEIPAEPTTGPIPVVAEPSAPSEPTPMIAISRPGQSSPQTPPETPVPPASAFEPPAKDEREEEQS